MNDDDKINYDNRKIKVTLSEIVKEMGSRMGKLIYRTKDSIVDKYEETDIKEPLYTFSYRFVEYFFRSYIHTHAFLLTDSSKELTEDFIQEHCDEIEYDTPSSDIGKFLGEVAGLVSQAYLYTGIFPEYSYFFIPPSTNALTYAGLKIHEIWSDIYKKKSDIYNKEIEQKNTSKNNSIDNLV